MLLKNKIVIIEHIHEFKHIAKPEQPDVFTPKRKPMPFPRFSRKVRTRSAAFSVNVIDMIYSYIVLNIIIAKGAANRLIMSVEKNADFAERIKIAGLKSTIKLDNTKQAAPQTKYITQIRLPS